MRISRCTQVGLRSMDFGGVERGERGDGFGGTSQYCLATAPYTLDQESRLDGIDMAAEHVISFESERTATLVFARALVSIARPCDAWTSCAFGHDE